MSTSAAERPRIPVSADGGGLGWDEARRSPCASCATSPCCSYLPLHHFGVERLADLDQAVFLLNFEGIELGIASDGTWTAYLWRTCRHLDPDDASCRVHATDLQPEVCVHYDPFTCWYRPALGEGHPGNLRLDRARLAWVLERVTFDEERRLTSAPSWEEMAEAFGGMPVAVPATDRRPSAGAGATATGRSTGSPCATCAAYCCTRLDIPWEPPRRFKDLDFLRFALGFPGVEVVVVGGTWALSIETTCRHLTGGRCGAFGTPDRPLRCTYFDEWSCSAKPVHRPVDPVGARVRYETYAALLASCSFDADAAIVAGPSPESLRPAVLASP